MTTIRLDNLIKDHAFLLSDNKSQSGGNLSRLQDNRLYLLSELLPYDVKKKRHSHLGDGIKEYKLLLKAAKEAFAAFLQGDLSSFDALVGENSCQIRATMIALMYKNAEDELKSLLNHINFIVKKIDALNNFSLNKSLGEFLEESQLTININLQEVFLISSYILTRVRELLPPNPSKAIVRNESTITRKVKQISDVGSSFARDLVKKLRALVSILSVSFVQKIAKELSLPKEISNMVSDQFCLSHDKFGRLKCLPCFWYTFILMQYSISIELPLVLIVSQTASDKEYKTINKEHFYFKVKNGKFQQTSHSDFSKHTPALVILGTSCRKESEFNIWKDEIQRYNPQDLILAYAAAHRQYPDETKDILVKNTQCAHYNFYKQKAHEWGCSLSNPSLFFLVHAYCDKMKHLHITR